MYPQFLHSVADTGWGRLVLYTLYSLATNSCCKRIHSAHNVVTGSLFYLQKSAGRPNYFLEADRCNIWSRENFYLFDQRIIGMFSKCTVDLASKNAGCWKQIVFANNRNLLHFDERNVKNSPNCLNLILNVLQNRPFPSTYIFCGYYTKSLLCICLSVGLPHAHRSPMMRFRSALIPERW